MPDRLDEPVRIAFGAALRELREQAGMTQERLAEASKLDRTYVSLLERGLRQPTLATLVRLHAALDISLLALIRAFERQLDRKA